MYFIKETECLHSELLYWQIFHTSLVTCLVKYAMFTGAVCPGHIHLCEYPVRILIKVLKQNTGFQKELSWKKNASMDVQEAFSYDFPLH